MIPDTRLNLSSAPRVGYASNWGIDTRGLDTL